MDATDFEAERSRLTAIVARILGSNAEADDVLQEAWLRLARAGEVEDLPAWLTTVVTRLCLDHLRTRRTRSAAESATPVDAASVDPEADALLAERVGEAMQVVLDTLAPAERAAFVLHDPFGYPFEEISAVLGRSRAAAVAARFDGARGAIPVSSDGDLGAAWILRGTVKVAFAFQVEGGLVREIELIGDPEVLATLDVTRRGQPISTR